MKKKSMKIGIDLGSTYSVFSEYNADTNSPETLKTDTAAPSSIPSVVCVNVDSNEVLAGFRAKNVMGDEEYAVFEAFKMLLIENDPDSLGQFGYNGENTPRKITTLFLKSILQDIQERYLTDDGVFEMVYICVPEIWCSETRNLDALDGKAILREILMKETGMPIKKVRVVTEPEAASAFFAWNYKKENRKAFNGHLLLIDYGGGTLDLTLTEVRSSEGGDMEIAYCASGGAGENHRDARGKVSVGSAGLQFMRTVLCMAIADTEGLGPSFEPDISGNDFAKAFKKLEDAFKDAKKQTFIRETFDSFGRYKNSAEILNVEPLVFTSFRFMGKIVTVTLQHVYKAYHDIIEGVVESELKKINEDIKSKLELDPCSRSAGNNDNFKIALVGGFGSFHLVRKQVSEIYNLADESMDKRVNMLRNININDRELAISLGASLLAAEKIVLKKTARFSIGIVSRLFNGQLRVRYGIKCHTRLEEGKPYFLLNDDSKPDEKGNRQPYTAIRDNISYFAYEDTENLGHGWLLALKQEMIERLRCIPAQGMWHIGFSIDMQDIITMHVEDHNGKGKPITIPLDSYGNLFELSEGVDIVQDSNTGEWHTSKELMI